LQLLSFPILSFVDRAPDPAQVKELNTLLAKVSDFIQFLNHFF